MTITPDPDAKFPISQAIFVSNSLRGGLGRVYERFAEALHHLDEAGHAGEILKTHFTTLKRQLNDCLEMAFREHIQERYTYNGRYQSLPGDVLEFEQQHLFAPALHNLESKLRRLRSTKLTHPLIADATALIQEWMPIVACINDLKDKAVTKQRSEVEEPKPGYHPPAVSTQAERIVLGLLEDGLESAYNVMLNQMVEHDRAEALRLLEELQSSGETKAHTYFARRIHNSKNRYEIAQLHADRDSILWLLKGDDAPFALNSNYLNMIIAASTRQADALRNAYVHKNLRKIASIVERRGTDGLTYSVRQTAADLRGMQGTYTFRWSDGAEFTVKNNAVYVPQTPDRVAHMRFPLTFHNVKEPGGVAFITPSEKRMNEVWCR